MADIERQYEYKGKWWHILFVVGFSTLLGAYTLRLTSPENSPVLFWIGLVLSVAGYALAGAMAVERQFFRRRIAFTPISLLLPLGFSGEQAIDYQAITGLKVSKIGRYGTGYLYVTYGGGRRSILETSLPSRAAFEEVCALLTARVRASEQVGPAEPSAAADGGA